MNPPTHWPPLKYVRAEVFVGFTIAAFAAGQVIVGWMQWDATNKQYEIMRLEQRAWLSPNGHEFGKLKADERLPAKLTFKNTGRTPAKVYRFKAFPATIDPALAPGTTAYSPQAEAAIEAFIAQPAWQTFDFTVPPDGTIHAFEPIGLEPISKERLDGVEQKSLRFVVVCIVCYRDVFNRECQTRADFEYEPTIGDWKSGAHVDMR